MTTDTLLVPHDPCLTNAQNLLELLEERTREHEQAKMDHARESHFNRDAQKHQMKLEEALRKKNAQIVLVPCLMKGGN